MKQFSRPTALYTNETELSFFAHQQLFYKKKQKKNASVFHTITYFLHFLKFTQSSLYSQIPIRTQRCIHMITLWVCRSVLKGHSPRLCLLAVVKWDSGSILSQYRMVGEAELLCLFQLIRGGR